MEADGRTLLVEVAQRPLDAFHGALMAGGGGLVERLSGHRDPRVTRAVDDAYQVQANQLVHLDQPPPAIPLGLGDQFLGSRELVPVLGQELDRGQEAVAGQARVGVRGSAAAAGRSSPCGAPAWRARGSQAPTLSALTDADRRRLADLLRKLQLGLPPR
ncbi:MAG: hypothetical protein ACRDPC_15895 [Solirubrobacteraceae bacterium]